MASFLWQSHSDRFSRKIIRRPCTQGGLACPDFHTYYLAAMLTHAHNWLVSEDTSASVVLEAAHLGSYEALRNTLYRGIGGSLITLTQAMKAVVRAWHTVVVKPNLVKSIWSPDTPLWCNPRLKEFHSLQDPGLWAGRGIKYLEDVCDGLGLFTFDRLKHKFQLPNSFFCRFLQLRHAFDSQFRSARG